MTCTRFSLNSRNRSAYGALLPNPHRSSASIDQAGGIQLLRPLLYVPPCPISKYATGPREGRNFTQQCCGDQAPLPSLPFALPFSPLSSGHFIKAIPTSANG